jgi:hypothetical protein
MVWQGLARLGGLVFLLSAQPALACHRYSSWSYPWPQSCKVSTASVQPRRTWFVEIVAPPLADDLTRSQAIEALKQELRLRSVQTLELQTIGLTQKKDNE